MFNESRRIVEERGYKCFDYLSGVDDLNLNYEKDFYNEWHVNLHGALKFTDVAAKDAIEVLKQIKPFPDNRSDLAELEKDWSDSLARYLDVIGPYCLDFERSHKERDYSIKAPELSLYRDDDDTVIKWQVDSDEEIDGYALYRRSRNLKEADGRWSSWEMIAELPKSSRKYIDENNNPGFRYGYTIVSFKIDKDDKIYGDYLYAGKNADALKSGPELKSIEDQGEKGVVVKWKPMKNALGYKIYRRLCGHSEWHSQAVIMEPEADTYVDLFTQEGLSYIYSVLAFYMDPEEINPEESIETGWKKQGLLLYREGSDIPSAEAYLNEKGVINLTWAQYKCADYYRIYRNYQDQGWELVMDEPEWERYVKGLNQKGLLDNTSPFSYTDSKAKEPGRYTYRVVPVITNGFREDIIEIKTEAVAIEKAN